MATQLLLILAVAYQPRLFKHIFPTSKEHGKEAANTPAWQRSGTNGVWVGVAIKDEAMDIDRSAPAGGSLPCPPLAV